MSDNEDGTSLDDTAQETEENTIPEKGNCTLIVLNY